nr:hypothetical protein [Tanacetum cinerariifolium]
MARIVTAIEESKELTSLSLDELIGNLKVYELIIKKDSKMVKDKREQSRSLTLKAKKNSSKDEKDLQDNHVMKESHSKEEEMTKMVIAKKCFRCGDPKHLIKECPMLLRSKNQRDFGGGTWSDNGKDEEEKTNKETFLVAQASNEIC